MAAHSHAVVKPTFWTGRTGRKLRAYPDAQRLALYLMTSPHRLMTGLYYLPKLYITHESGLKGDALDTALATLKRFEFSHYDEDAELVFVVTLATHQVGEELKASDNKVISIRRLVSPHRGHPFYDLFIDRYGECYHLNLEKQGAPSKGLQQPQKGLPEPLLPAPAPAPAPAPCPVPVPVPVPVPECEVGTPAPDGTGRVLVTAADACRVWGEMSGQPLSLSAWRDEFGAIAVQANQGTDPPVDLDEATGHLWREGGWAQQSRRATPKHLAKHFARELDELRGRVPPVGASGSPPKGPAPVSRPEDFGEEMRY